MWVIVVGAVLLFLVLLYWVVRTAVTDGVVAAVQRLEPGEQRPALEHPTDLIGLSRERPKRRPTGPSNY